MWARIIYNFTNLYHFVHLLQSTWGYIAIFYKIDQVYKIVRKYLEIRKLLFFINLAKIGCLNYRVRKYKQKGKPLTKQLDLTIQYF